jgi:hypothetical protein
VNRTTSADPLEAADSAARPRHGLLVRAWDRFFFREFDPYSVGVLRIALGLVWLAMLGFMMPNWERFFAADGLSGVVDKSLWQDPWSVFHYTDSLFSVWVWWFVGVTAGVLLTIGLFSRVAIFVCWALMGSMVTRTLMLVNGEDLVLRMVMFWCLFMPIGHELSVDARRWRRRNPGRERPRPTIWATRMLQLNVLCIYWFSLPLKLTTDPAWLNGNAFFFSVVNDTWARWPWPELFYRHWLSAIATYTAIFAEGTFGIWVWFRRTRTAAVVVMMSFHFMIAFMLQNVTFFNLSMIVCFWGFLDGATTRRWATWLTPRPADAAAATTRERETAVAAG